MIKSVKIITKNYADTFNQYTSEFNKQKKCVDDNYQGALWAENIGKCKEEYYSQIEKIRLAAQQKVKTIFEDAEIMIKSKVTDEIPQNAINQIQILENSNPTTKEMEIFLQKYRKNYLVCRRLKTIAEQRKINIDIVTIEDLIDSLKDLEQQIMEFFKIYNGPMKSYKAELILNGAIIDRVDNSLDLFFQES